MYRQSSFACASVSTIFDENRAETRCPKRPRSLLNVCA